MSPEPRRTDADAQPQSATGGPPAPAAATCPEEELSREDADALARDLKALADPIRLRLISLIGSHPEGGVSVFELAQAFHVTGPTLSHHLRILREAGMISARRNGTWVFYALVPENLATISGVLASTFSRRTADPATLAPHGTA